MTAPLTVDFKDLLAAMEATGKYRVLRRFEPVPFYCDPATRAADAEPLKTALFCDCETTGLDTARCSIIEFGGVQFRFDHRTGVIYNVSRVVSALEDPGFPIPPEITELTGIVDADVQGRRIDDEAVKDIVGESDLVICFNSEYDRPILERRFPIFVDKHFACAMSEVPWVKFGARGRKHDYLLAEVLRQFHDAHRAVDDCQVGVHLLATAPSVVRANESVTADVLKSPFQFLLESVMTPRRRVWALDAPFPKKELLKAHKYRWSDGTDGRRKGWFRDVAAEAVDAERAFLEAEVYQSQRTGIFVAKVTSRDRYSVRA